MIWDTPINALVYANVDASEIDQWMHLWTEWIEKLQVFYLFLLSKSKVLQSIWVSANNFFINILVNVVFLGFIKLFLNENYFVCIATNITCQRKDETIAFISIWQKIDQRSGCITVLFFFRLHPGHTYTRNEQTKIAQENT